MDPSKEAKYILSRFIDEWFANFNLDGWIIMVRWMRLVGDFGSWEICVAHPDFLGDGTASVGVRGIVTRDEWEEHPITIVAQRAEEMHAEVFKRENQAPAGDVAFRAREPWWRAYVR